MHMFNDSEDGAIFDQTEIISEEAYGEVIDMVDKSPNGFLPPFLIASSGFGNVRLRADSVVDIMIDHRALCEAPRDPPVNRGWKPRKKIIGMSSDEAMEEH